MNRLDFYIHWVFFIEAKKTNAEPTRKVTLFENWRKRIHRFLSSFLLLVLAPLVLSLSIFFISFLFWRWEKLIIIGMKIFCHHFTVEISVGWVFSLSCVMNSTRKSFSTELITCRRICWHMQRLQFRIINHLSMFMCEMCSLWFSTWSLMKWLGVTPANHEEPTEQKKTCTTETNKQIRFSECETLIATKRFSRSKVKDKTSIFFAARCHPSSK